MTSILGVAFTVFLVLNANGREIPSADSQAAKYSALQLARRHSLTLDGVVGHVPQYTERLAFQRDRDGHWRNAYPLPPVLEGAFVAASLRALGVLHFDAPLAASTVAKITASALVSVAAVFALLLAAQFCGRRCAVAVAIAFPLASGIWPIAGQSLWQHATLIWSITAALYLWARNAQRDTIAPHMLIGALLGWAASARPQTLPMIGIVLAGIVWSAGPHQRWASVAAFLTPMCVFAGLNIVWFGHPFGQAATFAATSLEIHRVSDTWQWPGPGLLGLLFSPSRGILVFSPVLPVMLAARPTRPERPIVLWTAAAAAVQLLVYASFSVWWGGHTYGPRYVLDILPLLLPLTAIASRRIAASGIVSRVAVAAALAWSVAAAATGAFCYPNDRWNTEPVSVDQFHERLWDVRDSQILRCWHEGLSPQNFSLFSAEAWRRQR